MESTPPEHKMPSQMPTVTFEDLTYTVTLFRSDAKGALKKHEQVFGEHSLNVCAAHPSTLSSWQISQIKSAPADDGLLYYIHAQPYDVGATFFLGLENKAEALAIKRELSFIEERERYAREGCEDEERYEDTPCTFCGKTPDGGCSEDHGDDMRDWMRAELERD